jgi:ornithine carbamoyltransferase
MPATPTVSKPPRIAARHVLRDTDVAAEELRELIDLAIDIKAAPRRYRQALDRCSVALLFEKPSLRTRVTFELAVKQLGGDSIYQDHRDGRIGEREPAKDMARNLDRWVQAIVARTFSQKTLEDLARWSSVPVINALSDTFHPCQVMGDFQTIKERFGKLEGLRMAFVGDGNNVCHSLLLCASRLGISMNVVNPPGYEPNVKILDEARSHAAKSGATIRLMSDPEEGVEGVSAVYTDIWTSMGFEAETQQRRIAFADYQVTDDLMAKAGPNAVFMHCLPASRGEEVMDSVIESPRSVVFDQAENRLHAQKALLIMLLGSREDRES